MKKQNLQKEPIDRKVEIQKEFLESYSSRQKFHQLTKNIPRFYKNTSHQGSFSSEISQKLIKTQIQASNNSLPNQSDPLNQTSPKIPQKHDELRNSSSVKYFTLQNVQKQQSDQKNNRQVFSKDPAFKNLQQCLNQVNSKSKKNEKSEQKAVKRFKPLISVVLLQVAINIMFGIPALYMFFTLDSLFKQYLATVQYCFITLFYLSSSFYIVWGHGRKGFIEFLMMHILIDTLLLILVVVSIGFIGMLTVFFSDQWFSWVNVIGIPLMNFFFIGNFRLFLKWAILTPWQIILWKITFFIDGMIYFGIGAYYMAVDYKLTQGYLPDVESKLKDFCLLFVFANFSLYIEMFGAIGSRDKTEDLQYEYVMSQDSNEQKNDQEKKGYCKYCNHCTRQKRLQNDKIKSSKKQHYQNSSDCNNMKEEQKGRVTNQQNHKQLFEIPEQSPIGRQDRLVSVEYSNLGQEVGDSRNNSGDRMFFTINKINWSNTKSQSHQFALTSL